MLKNNPNSANIYKFAIVGIMLIGASVSIYYFHLFAKTDIFFVPLFYFPIILAAIWWPRMGFIIALALVVQLLGVHILMGVIDKEFVSDILRSSIFIAISALIGVLTRRMELHRIMIENAKRDLEKKVAERTEDLKQANLQLAESADRFKIVSKATNDIIWDWNLRTDDLRWNEGMQTAFGYRPEQIEPTIDSWYNRIHQDDRDRVVTGIHEAINSGKAVWSAEYRFRRSDGSYAHIFDRGYVIYDVSGKAVRMVGAMLDMSERKKAENDLRRSEYEKAMILDSASEIIAYHDNDHNIQWANNAYLKSTGLSIEQIKGRKCYSAWGLDRACDNCPVTAAIASGKAERRELTPENQPHWPADQGSWMAAAAPVKDASGNIIGAIEIAHNITEQKKAEAELQKYRDHLEDLVSIRTAELEKVTKEREEEKNLAAIGALASAVAHRLRTPLGAIRLAAFNIRAKLHDSKLERHFDNIEKKIAETDDIIKNLLFYTTSTGRPIYENIDIHDMLEDSAGEVSRRFALNKISVARKYGAARHLYLEGDAAQLKEVFMNILTNSYEAIADKPGNIEIGTEEVEGGLKIYIRDDGPGIDREYMRQVGQPFFSTKTSGTGIGLAICSKIVRLHDGSIDIDSEKGKGTTVSITLPVTRGGGKRPGAAA